MLLLTFLRGLEDSDSSLALRTLANLGSNFDLGERHGISGEPSMAAAIDALAPIYSRLFFDYCALTDELVLCLVFN